MRTSFVMRHYPGKSDLRGAITASSQQAADAGAKILYDGGNAADAAIASALATCVADPSNVGLGGYGGYMLVQQRNERARCIQFPLCAPSNCSPQTLAVDYPESGPDCSSLPNVVGGLGRAWREFGHLPWSALVQRAIDLARDGVQASAQTRRALELCRDYPFVRECFVFNEDITRLGFRQPLLTRTLEMLAERGPAWFYEGPIADAAVRASREVAIPLDDWRRQDEVVEVVDAPVFDCGPVRVQAAALGLSGSACLFAMCAAAARIGERFGFDAPNAIAELARAMASIWQYRFTTSGGNDISQATVGDWVARALAFEAAQETSLGLSHTAHLNAVDSDGMMVALTFTHGPVEFGGRWAIPGTGIIMNGGMHNFSRGAMVNRNGRWLGISNMTPTIATDESGNRLALGCPGARRIPSNIAMVIAWHYLAGLTLQQAVSAGRVHCEHEGRVSCETNRLGPERFAALRRRFPVVDDETGENYFGPLTAIAVDSSGNVDVGLDDRLFTGFAAHA
ncbi:MAG TPA: gamma-glutamyltransferase [Casimicrobiaceae bacterium]|nr:gamma-glutamyltransferase [Casimicrobiaceae bacterium]